MPLRLLPSILALAMTVGAGVLPAAPAVVTPSATSGVTVIAAPAASGTLQPGQDLQVTATVSNGTSGPMVAATAQVFLGHEPIASQTALAAWQDADAGAAGGDRIPAGGAADPELAAGQRQTLSFTIPAATIGLDSRPWGVHPLSVRVVSAGSSLGSAHSNVIWYPSTANHATRLAIVAPITAPTQSIGLIGADVLAAYTAPGGLLERQLDQAIGRRVTLAIDPMILASIRILGSSAPLSAVQWLDRLDEATNETFALSYADSDIAATSQAGSAEPLAPTSFAIDPGLFAAPEQPTPTPTPTPSDSATPTPSPSTVPIPPLPTPESLVDWDYTLSGVAWPGEDTVSENDLSHFGAAAASTHDSQLDEHQL